MSRVMRWTSMRPDELPDVVELHPLSTPGETIAYVREDDDTVDAFILGLKVVRCMDCAWFENNSMCGAFCRRFDSSLHDDYDGFCKWGERKVVE